MSIYEKLSRITAELFVPKGQKNDFGKYNYRSCEDILKTVKPICERNKCVLFITNDIEQAADRVYVKATVKLVDLESGDCIESVAHAREEEVKKGMDGSQITGAASSYARKYALAGLFCIDNEKDSDATNTHGKDTTNDPVVEAELKSKVIGYINRHNMDADKIAKICKTLGVDSLQHMTAEHCKLYITKLEQSGGNIDE